MIGRRPFRRPGRGRSVGRIFLDELSGRINKHNLALDLAAVVFDFADSSPLAVIKILADILSVLNNDRRTRARGATEVSQMEIVCKQLFHSYAFSVSIELGSDHARRRSMMSVKNIQSLTSFKRNTNESVELLKKSKGLLVLTVNGKAELVVMGADEFDEMQRRLEEAETVQAVRSGIEAFERGEVLPAREALAGLKEKHDI
jgi:PHD/YefM family antitoxin component YafN of YafNO toxin-antitoxin module